MSYNQHMKHWHNHRKDRYHQQCAPPISREGTMSSAMISELFATSFHVEVDGRKVSADFTEIEDAYVSYDSLSKEDQLHAAIVDNLGITVMR